MDDEKEQLPPEDAERLARIEKLFEELGQLQEEMERDLGGVDSDEDNEEE